VLVDQQFLQIAGPAADSMYLVSFWHPSQPDPGSRGFVARFTTMVGRPPRHDDAMFYDAVMLMGTAIRSAGAERTAVRDYLASLGRTRPPYEGITGPIAFTDEAHRPLLMTRIRAGRTEVLPP
jgi:branched-chain amino acid transport system substrate-binding protein